MMGTGSFRRRNWLFGVAFLLCACALAFSAVTPPAACAPLLPTKMTVTSQPLSGGAYPVEMYLYNENMAAVQGSNLPKLVITPVEGGQIIVIKNDNPQDACKTFTDSGGKAYAQVAKPQGAGSTYECVGLRAVFCPNSSEADIQSCTGIKISGGSAGLPACNGNTGAYKDNFEYGPSQASTQLCPDAQNTVNAPFCGMIALIFALLLAAAFFQGRNPLQMFDFGAARGLRVGKGGGYMPMAQNVNVNPVAIATSLVQTADQATSGSNKDAEAAHYKTADGTWTTDKEAAAQSFKDAGKALPGNGLETKMMRATSYMVRQVDEKGKVSYQHVAISNKIEVKDAKGNVTYKEDTKTNDRMIAKTPNILRDADGAMMRYTEARGWKAMDSQVDKTSNRVTLIGGITQGWGASASGAVGSGIDSGAAAISSGSDTFLAKAYNGAVSGVAMAARGIGNLSVRMAPVLLAAGVSKKRGKKAFDADIVKTGFNEELRRELWMQGFAQAAKGASWLDGQMMQSPQEKKIAELKKQIDEKQKQLDALEKRMIENPGAYLDTKERLDNTVKAGGLTSEQSKLEAQLIVQLRAMPASIGVIGRKIEQNEQDIRKLDMQIKRITETSRDEYGNALTVDEKKARLEMLEKSRAEMVKQTAALKEFQAPALAAVQSAPKLLQAWKKELEELQNKQDNAAPLTGTENARKIELVKNIGTMEKEVLPKLVISDDLRAADENIAQITIAIAENRENTAMRNPADVATVEKKLATQLNAAEEEKVGLLKNFNLKEMGEGFEPDSRYNVVAQAIRDNDARISEIRVEMAKNEQNPNISETERADNWSRLNSELGTAMKENETLASQFKSRDEAVLGQLNTEIGSLTRSKDAAEAEFRQKTKYSEQENAVNVSAARVNAAFAPDRAAYAEERRADAVDALTQDTPDNAPLYKYATFKPEVQEEVDGIYANAETKVNAYVAENKDVKPEDKQKAIAGIYHAANVEANAAIKAVPDAIVEIRNDAPEQLKTSYTVAQEAQTQSAQLGAKIEIAAINVDKELEQKNGKAVKDFSPEQLAERDKLQSAAQQDVLDGERGKLLSELEASQKALAATAWKEGGASSGITTGIVSLLEQLEGAYDQQKNKVKGANFGYMSAEGWAAYLGPLAGSFVVEPFVGGYTRTTVQMTGMLGASSGMSAYDLQRMMRGR